MYIIDFFYGEPAAESYPCASARRLTAVPFVWTLTHDNSYLQPNVSVYVIHGRPHNFRGCSLYPPTISTWYIIHPFVDSSGSEGTYLICMLVCHFLLLAPFVVFCVFFINFDVLRHVSVCAAVISSTLCCRHTLRSLGRLVPIGLARGRGMSTCWLTRIFDSCSWLTVLDFSGMWVYSCIFCLIVGSLRSLRSLGSPGSPESPDLSCLVIFFVWFLFSEAAVLFVALFVWFLSGGAIVLLVVFLFAFQLTGPYLFGTLHSPILFGWSVLIWVTLLQ